MRQYLLDQLPEDAKEEVEVRLLTDPDYANEFDILVDEITEQYAADAIPAQERESVERHFLKSETRREKLKFMLALREKASERSRVKNRQPYPWLKYAALAAALVIVVLGAWWIIRRPSEVDTGLLALNQAYREQRPLEARISSLSYAPFPQTRGGVDRIDTLARNRAESILSAAVNDRPSPAAHHALGEAYLAKKQFDDAIKELDEALKSDPKNAQIYNDLGAAWLEKGKIDLEKGSSDPRSALTGKGMEELGRGLDHLTSALKLNSNLLEALFNRALCRQELGLSWQAEEDWKEYLKRDANSPWATEARRKLELLQERENKKSETSEELLERFLVAYESQSDDVAWSALSPSRSRAGNQIVEALIDKYLGSAAKGDVQANSELRKLNYAGKVESEKVGDRFTLELSRFYGSATPTQRGVLTDARQTLRTGLDRYNAAEWQEAINLFSRARALFLSVNDESEALFAHAWAGYCYLRIPDRDQSSRIFQRLAAVFENKSYKSLFAQTLLAQADAIGPNEFSRLMEQANRALAVSEQIQDSANAVRCLQAGTSMQLILGNYRESLAATFRALTIAGSLPPDAKLTEPFYHETSLDFYFLGLPEVALMFEDEALRQAREAHLPFHASRAYDRLALIFERLQNYDEAMKNARAARVEAQGIRDQKSRANTTAHSALNLARLYRESGDPKQALTSVDEALNLYESLNVDIYQYAAHKEKFLSLKALNDNQAAEAELAIVLSWFEQNREKIVEETYRDKFFDNAQNTYDLAIDFEASRMENEWKAFDYAERSRARSLLDLMTTGALIVGESDNPELKISGSASPLSIAEVQQRLPARTQLLEYSILDDKVISWLVTRNDKHYAQIKVSRNELGQKIRNYVNALSSGSGGDATERTNQAKELYAKLIAPLERFLNPQLQLCVVPTDNLSFLPFAALVSPNSNKYLLEEYAIETSPSATIFINNSEHPDLRAQRTRERALVVGDPQFDQAQFPDLRYLPAAAREAREVATLYNSTLLVGDAATAPRVTSELGSADVAHFATHAVPDEQTPLRSKLLLAKEMPTHQSHHPSSGFIQVSEIYGMKLSRTRLVVLSACQTGIERAYRGEGAIGLARPFIAAGVPLVVATLWPVDSEQAANLMISFHKHRKEDHASTVEALRRAQLEALRNSQSGSMQNYDWAAFVTIGGYASF